MFISDGSPLKEDKLRITIVGNSNVRFTRANVSDSGRYMCLLEAGDAKFEREYHLEVLGNILLHKFENIGTSFKGLLRYANCADYRNASKSI